MLQLKFWVMAGFYVF